MDCPGGDGEELSLPITQEQIDELKRTRTRLILKWQRELVRHDVMSHVYAYGVQCPQAKGIIHLGATSCYVGDNTDIIIMAEALEAGAQKLINVLHGMAVFADKVQSRDRRWHSPISAGPAHDGGQEGDSVDDGAETGFG